MAQEPGGRPEQSERPIPHDRSFLDVARVKLDGQEYVQGRGYRLHPGSDLYRTFVTFLAEELERLPFDGAVGEAIPMRGDAREVVARLAAYLRDQAAHAAPGVPWDRDRNSGIADIFRGWLEVFKNEIYAGTGQSGMCYSLDLGAQHVMPSDEWVPRGIILERFWVSQGGTEGVVVQRNGKLALDLHNGPITVDLDDGNVTNVYVR